MSDAASSATIISEPSKTDKPFLQDIRLISFDDLSHTDLQHVYAYNESTLMDLQDEIQKKLKSKKIACNVYISSKEKMPHYSRGDNQLKRSQIPPLIFSMHEDKNALDDYEDESYSSDDLTDDDGNTLSAGSECKVRSDVEVLDLKFRYIKDKKGSWNDRCKTDLFVLLKIDSFIIPFTMSLAMVERLFGATIGEDFQLHVKNKTFYMNQIVDKVLECVDIEFRYGKGGYSGGEYHDTPFAMSWNGFTKLSRHFLLKNTVSKQSLLRGIAKTNKYPIIGAVDVAKKGIAKTYAKIKPISDACLTTNPLAALIFEDLANESGKTVDRVKQSTVFNSTFADVKDEKSFLKALDPLIKDAKNDWKLLPVYKEQRKKAIKSTAGRAFSKLMEEAESLNLDKKQFPLLTKAVESGELPIGIFFRKSEQYFLLNDNFPLWEKMLKHHKEVTLALANEASRRTTYEKDLMSYFYFVLYGLPEYLKKHTGYKWTCSPKLVNSPSELEPPAADDKTGIVRKRSALTPIVDNENKHVVVPYASLAMPGRQTTYCYSHSYHVIQRGFTFNGNTATLDLEEKLNGRDDYGLMFYTLTGSAQGRGYPTFLIIFERLDTFGQGTRVHFHRTHPSRSKQGDYNPVNRWISVCYNWMVGNVNRNLVRNQQGDMVFIEDTNLEREYPNSVDFYDKHVFDSSVKFAPYEKKDRDNVLGYMLLEQDNWLRHSEHEDILLPAGRYLVRQARSWEASPSGVWSLRID